MGKGSLRLVGRPEGRSVRCNYCQETWPFPRRLHGVDGVVVETAGSTCRRAFTVVRVVACACCCVWSECLGAAEGLRSSRHHDPRPVQILRAPVGLNQSALSRHYGFISILYLLYYSIKPCYYSICSVYFIVQGHHDPPSCANQSTPVGAVCLLAEFF
jgi:hypothetical protein